jgi:hypothetical protein
MVVNTNLVIVRIRERFVSVALFMSRLWVAHLMMKHMTNVGASTTPGQSLTSKFLTFFPKVADNVVLKHSL